MLYRERGRAGKGEGELELIRTTKLDPWTKFKVGQIWMLREGMYSEIDPCLTCVSRWYTVESGVDGR